MRGPLRAAAFLGLAERFLEGDLPRSLGIGGNMQIALLPDPVPDEMAAELGPEFRHWVISNSLRELDQFLSLMLDECWDMVEACRIVAGQRPPNYQWQRIDRQTNVAEKHRLVLEAAGRFAAPHLDDNEFLATLSNARNCISHNLGVVDARRAPSGSLTVRWLCFRTAIVTSDAVYFMDDVELPFEVPGEEGGEVRLEVVIAEREFALGERIIVTPHELMQIALLYQMIVERVVGAMVEHAREAGVPFNEPPPQLDTVPPQ